MIRLSVENYCHVCPDFDPVVEKLYILGEPCNQSIHCKYSERCRVIEEHIRKCSEQEMKGEKPND